MWSEIGWEPKSLRLLLFPRESVGWLARQVINSNCRQTAVCLASFCDSNRKWTWVIFRKWITMVLQSELVTALQRSCGKVMFSQVCIWSQGWVDMPGLRDEYVQGLGIHSWTWDVTGKVLTPPVLTSSSGHLGGFYACYWNTFLLFTGFAKSFMHSFKMFPLKV